jgi:hypothetical protein
MTLSLLDPPPEDPQPTDTTLPPPAGWPAPPAPAVYHELLGEIVTRIAPHTEADRATRGRTLRVSYADWRIG